MKIGADGSLCRITRSMIDCVTSLKIVKTPDDQLKESEPSYKLVLIDKEDEYESASEKSDEEMFDEEIIPTENFDKKKEIYNKADEECSVNKPESKTMQENNNTRDKNFYHRNRNGFFDRTRNPSRTPKTFHLKSKDEKGYNYNSAKRNPATQSSSYSMHDMSSAHEISPWINPPMVLGQPANFAYSAYGYQNAMQEPVIPVPVSSCAENLGKRLGLLGDKPGASGITNFPLNNHYIQNQASHFSPPAANFPANDPNYWDSSYEPTYQNYHPPAPETSMPGHSHRNDYYRRKPNFKNKRGPKHGNWKRNQGRRNPPNQYNTYGN